MFLHNFEAIVGPSKNLSTTGAQWNGMESMECSAVEWNGMESMECSAVEWNGMESMECSAVEWNGMESMECSAVEWYGMESMEWGAMEWNGMESMEWSAQDTKRPRLVMLAHCGSFLRKIEEKKRPSAQRSRLVDLLFLFFLPRPIFA